MPPTSVSDVKITKRLSLNCLITPNPVPGPIIAIGPRALPEKSIRFNHETEATSYSGTALLIDIVSEGSMLVIP